MELRYKLAAGFAAFLLCTTAAHAVTFTIDSVVGTWENTVDANGNSVSGEGTSQIRWGDPATDDGQSGYDFDAAISSPLVQDELFVLGEFNHLNFPVFPPSLVSADLAISIDGNADGVNFAFNSIFSYDHFETPNGGSPCAAGGSQPCPDLVTLLNPQDTSQIVAVNNIDYTLEIAGFVTDPTNITLFLDSFLTLEEQENEAFLVARFSETIVNQIPLPAAGWMLLAGIGGMAAFRRKTKA